MNPFSLSDQDLLAELVGPRVAKKLYRGSLASLLMDGDPPDADRRKLIVANEMVRRALREEIARGDAIRSPKAIYDYLKLILAGKQQEVFLLLILDAHYRVLKVEEVFKGTLTQAPVYNRDVVKLAVLHNAAAVVLVHNHPSGDAEPSIADHQKTRILTAALRLVEVVVLDHIVVAGSTYTSFRERGFLEL
jgi:DNA repair protein RadC